MRLAGTASQYSKKAMPQLTSTAAQIGAALYFRWPDQAKVMNTLEATSRMIGVTVGSMGTGCKAGGTPGLAQPRASGEREACAASRGGLRTVARFAGCPH